MLDLAEAALWDLCEKQQNASLSKITFIMGW